MAKVRERRIIDGDQKSRTIRYYITDALDDRDALNVAENPGVDPEKPPLSYDLLPRENLIIREVRKRATDENGRPDITVADGIYYVDAIYSRSTKDRPEPQKNSAPDPADAATHKDTYSFEVSAQSERLFVAPNGEADRIAVFPGNMPNTATDYEAVNRNGLNYQGVERGFEGIDVPMPRGSFQLTWYPEDAKMTLSKELEIKDAVGKVNTVTYFGHEPGEVLCASVTGQGRLTDDWVISARFEVAKNRTSVDIGNDITIPAVEGWDTIDVEYIEATTEVGTPTKKVITRLPRQATIWRLLGRVDFNTVFNL